MGPTILLFVALVIMTNAYVPNVNDKIRNFCIDDSGVSVEMVENLLANPEKDLIDVESCYVHCIFTEMGLLSENGNVEIENFESLKASEAPYIDLNCLDKIKSIDNCCEMMLLRACHV
uniref:Odorant binding protein 16 n=1 Tax=Dendroctonus adjunctus TaxID=77157 RepID=A0A7U3W599_9CUCU|nr:Odorant binding protein 16 [Dendroctonus adjunctus]